MGVDPLRPAKNAFGAIVIQLDDDLGQGEVKRKLPLTWMTFPVNGSFLVTPEGL